MSKHIYRWGFGDLKTAPAMRGHAKKCLCFDCYRAKVEMMDKPRLPESPDQLVPVRAHFRRCKNYMSKADARDRKLVKELVAVLMKKSGS